MSVILKSGSSGNLADVVNIGGVFGLAVSVQGSLAAGSNIIGQVEMTDGTNVLGTVAHPVVTSQAPAQDIIVAGTISGTGQNVVVTAQGSATIQISITGSWGGTLEFEHSADGTNWLSVPVFPKPLNTPAVTSTTINGVWLFASAGGNLFRVIASGWSIGTASIHLEAAQGSQVVEVYQLSAANLLTTSTCTGTFQYRVTKDTDVGPQSLSVLPAHVSAYADNHQQDELSYLHVDLLGNLRTRNRSESILGDIVAIPRLNQVEINFSEGFDAGLITNSASGGPSGGSFITATGAAEWHTGTASTGQATGVSTQQLKYHPGHEWYSKFTAAFTTPTDHSNPNHQRIGP